MMTEGYRYALQCVNGEKEVGRYIKKQCQVYIDTVDGKINGANFDVRRYKRLCALLKIMIQPKGINAGKTFFESIYGFQWLMLEAIFCVVDDDNIRLYQNLTMCICRKNGKSALAGLIFIIALLTEPKFSKLYSISVNAKLARETMEAMREILFSSPALFDKEVAASGRGRGGKFAVTANYIKCPLNDTQYQPLGNNPRAYDGLLCSFAAVDEVGALPTNGPIEAVRASQITLLEKLTILLSTRYPGADNPMEQEIAYCKKVLDGVIDDKRTFALLYEPDDEIKPEWMDNDAVLLQSNPLAAEIPSMWNALIDKRNKAIESEASRGYFLCKNCNIQSEDTTEQFVPIELLKRCRVETNTLKWQGKQVYVGVDLSLVSDNSTVCLVSKDENGNLIVLPKCFIPASRVEEKTRKERVDYRRYINNGLVIACGELTVDYSVIENYVINLERELGVEVMGIYADPWNCQSSAQKWEENGLPVVLVKQLSYILHGPTSFLEKSILDGKFRYETNPLLEINFENCRCMYDTNDHRYINKKKSNGKIDLCAAIVNGVYGLFQDSLTDTSFGAITF